MSERVSSAPKGSERLADRRKSRRRRSFIALFSVLLILAALALYGLWQSAVRIKSVEVFGADASFADYAMRAMRGSYLGIIPHDSIFFFPESAMRTDILAEHPEIAAISLFRSSLTSISIKVIPRVAVVKWCGLSHSEGVDAYCYLIDSGGFIFGIASPSSETLNSFTLYAPLAGDTLEPLRGSIAQFSEVSHIFDFARQMAGFGSPTIRVTVHDGEVDTLLASGTRITYLLGDEQNAYTALVSARANLNLADGSIEYIDLRFDGKMYLKRN
jgi:hypothetical protein